MVIKTVQWNIGGGFISDEGSDRSDDLSYSKAGIDHIISVLKNIKPDLITFQEIHDGKVNQAEVISKALGFEYFVIDRYDKSHLEEGAWLSQAIITKFPISKHEFNLFPNPNVDVRFGANQVGKSHDKGITSVSLNIEGTGLKVKTLHMIPFRRTDFAPTDPIYTELREDLCNKIVAEEGKILLQGDVNFNSISLAGFITAIADKGLEEVVQKDPTTPEGQMFDHVVYKDIKVLSSKVDNNVLTDHFPIISEFEIND